MTIVLWIILMLTIAAVTAVGVGLLRTWTLKRGILDHPNERSSHEVPTPRGGGLVIAVVALSSLAAAAWWSGLPIPYAYVIGAGLIVIISWADDVLSLSFLIRLCVHFLAAAIVVWASIDLYQISSASIRDLLLIAAVIIWIVWMTNAFNFMDGIDGIAGLQGLVAGFGWFVVGYTAGNLLLSVIAAAILAACAGFLVWNWSPAKIFMGDAGSAFLGFTFASIPFVFVHQNMPSRLGLIAVGAAFVWPFVFDSVFTLFRRLIRGDKVWRAHREHLYQHLVISGWSHPRAALLYGAAAVVSGGVGLVFGAGDLTGVLAITIAAAATAFGILAATALSVRRSKDVQ